MSDELVELAAAPGRPTVELLRGRMAHDPRPGDRGPGRRSSPALRGCERWPRLCRSPRSTFLRLMFESGWAFVQGELQAAEQWAIQMFEVGTASGQPDAATDVWRDAARGLATYQGRSGSSSSRSCSSPAKRTASRRGARPRRSPWSRAAARMRRASWCSRRTSRASRGTGCGSGAMFSWADVCSRLRIADRAGELLRAPGALRRPTRGQRRPGVCGSIPSALGALASTLERYEQAEEHFAAAAEIEERLRRAAVPRPHARRLGARADRPRPARGPRARAGTCSSRPRTPPSAWAASSSLGKSRSAAPRFRRSAGNC